MIDPQDIVRLGAQYADGPPGDDEDEMVCGESYEHDLSLLDSRDGISSYECRNCGAEVFSEDDEDGS